MIDRQKVEALIVDMRSRREFSYQKMEAAADVLARLLLERTRAVEALNDEMRGWDDPDDDE